MPSEQYSVHVELDQASRDLTGVHEPIREERIFHGESASAIAILRGELTTASLEDEVALRLKQQGLSTEQLLVTLTQYP